MAPLCRVLEVYIVYGLTSLIHTVQMEPITYTSDELREDLLASVHAVLLAPVLEELCYRQLSISPFRRRWVQVVVCVLMALLFGIVHVRNFLGASLAAMLFPFHNLAVAARSRTFAERDGLGVLALREA